MMLTVLLSEIRSLKCSILSIWDSLIKILMSIHSGKALQVYIVIIGMKLLFPTVETRSRWLDRWSESNPNGSMPRLGGTINNNYSSFWLTKGDYLRLKNLEIGYTFRQRELLTKLGVRSLRLYLAGTNLLTFTSLDDYDPEKLRYIPVMMYIPIQELIHLVLTLNFKSNNYEIN